MIIEREGKGSGRRIFSNNEKMILVGCSILVLVLAVLLLFRYQRIELIIQPALGAVSADDIVRGDCEGARDAYAEAVEILPAPILQSFVGNGWTFVVDAEYLAELTERDQMLWTGATDYAERRISVCSPDSVLHEFGHYLTWALGFPACHTSYYLLEAKDAKTVLGFYSAVDGREYFAEFFEFWLTHQGDSEALAELEVVAPETYRYFADLAANSWGLDTKRISFRRNPDPEQLKALLEAEAMARENDSNKIK